ncbi:MAG: OmpA family protein [Myxococcales bacterium]|nr:OmpA family protein [Myxococcales bacterium]
MRLSWTRVLLSAGISLATVMPTGEAWAVQPESDGAGAPADAGDADASAPADGSDDAGAGAGGEASGSIQLGAGGAKGDASASGDAEGPKKPKKSRKGWGVEDQDKPLLYRYKPERNTWEVGIFGGLFLPDERHDFYHPDTSPQKALWLIGPEIGLRAAYMALPFLGVEAEFSAIPTAVRNGANTFAFVYGFRGHALLQAPGTRIAPFLLGGYGGMGVASSDDPRQGLGKDLDGVGHLGIGLKVYINRYMAARFDARQIIGAKAATQGDWVHHFSVLFGLTFTLGRSKKVIDNDLDKDGILNDVDVCPMAPGIPPDGCPPKDLDGDSIYDHEDRCPCDPGEAPSGCPTGLDTDKDGFPDEVDECPTEPGIAPVGCPVRDADNDGFPDEKDTCPMKPETRNGFEDGDGCPDEIPEKLKKSIGVLEGITFEFNSEKIRRSSRPTLDEAAESLKEFPMVRVRIEGHTDNVGDPAYNLELSKKRAAEVKNYLVEKGVPEAQLETEGFGDTKPRETEDTDAARAKNRRIEFVLITEGAPSSE